METKQIILTKNAPEPIGPYNQGIIINNLIFTSGQIGIDPKTQKLVEGGIKEETTQVLRNLREVLIAAGSDLEKVIKVNVYLTDLKDFSEMNSAYQEFFTKNYPARTTVQVAALPKGARIEIDVIAVK